MSYLPNISKRTSGIISISKTGSTNITKFLSIRTFGVTPIICTFPPLPMDVNICAIAIGGGNTTNGGGSGALAYSYRTLKKTDVLTYYVGSYGQSSWVKINDVTIALGGGGGATNGTGSGDVVYYGSSYCPPGYTGSGNYNVPVAGTSVGVTFDGTNFLNPNGNFANGYYDDGNGTIIPARVGSVTLLISSTDFVRTPFNYATYNSSK